MARSGGRTLPVGVLVCVDSRYVMTECSQHMIKWWKQNEFLLPFLDQHLLDIAFYDSENPQNVRVR